MEKKKKVIKWSILGVLVVAFVLLMIFIKTGLTKNIDDAVWSFFVNLRTDTLTTIAKLLSKIGGVLGMGIIGVLLIIFIKDNKIRILIPVNVGVGFVVNKVVQLLMQRQRPEESYRLVEESSYSFPSGHAMNNTVFYAFLIYLVCMKIKNKKLRNALLVIIPLLVVSIGISRLYLGVHFVTDIIGGILLGVIYSIVFVSIVSSKVLKNKEKEKEE